MKFFLKNLVFIKKILIIIFLVIIIILLIIGRFRTMRVKMVGLEGGVCTFRGMGTHLLRYGDTLLKEGGHTLM